jgi:hypothetical protein
VLRMPDSNTLRSNTLWKGLRTVRAPFFGILDDDDSLHPNHVATLVERLLQTRNCRFAYSGVIQAEDEDGVYFDAPNYHAGFDDRIISERRTLRFLEPFNKTRLLRLDNYITSNAWLASLDLLDSRVLTDPDLPVGEDLYLLLMFMRQTEFVPTWQPTAACHFRSLSKDNSVLRRELWQDWQERIRLRTHLDFGRPLMDDHLVDRRGLASKALRGIWRSLRERRVTKLMGGAVKVFRESGVSGLLGVLIRKGS